MTPTSFESAAELLGRAFAALSGIVGEAQTLEVGLAALGWAPPPSVDLTTALALDTSQVVAKLEVVVNSTPDERNDEALMIARYADLAAAIVALVKEIDAFAADLPQSLGAAGNYSEKTNIAAALPVRLLDFVVAAGMQSISRPAAALLRFAGVVKSEHFAQDDSIYQVEHERAIVDARQLSLLVSDPAAAFKSAYGWGTSAFDAETLLENAGLVLQSLGGHSAVADMDDRTQAKIGQSPTAADSAPIPQLLVDLVHELGEEPVDAMLSLHRLRVTAAGGTDAGIELAPYLRGAADLEIPLTGALSFLTVAELDIEEGVGIALRPTSSQLRSGLLSGGPSAVTGDLAVGLKLAALPDGAQRQLLSAPGGIALTFTTAEFQAGVKEVAGGQAPDAYVRGAVTGGKLGVGSQDADGFLQHELPSKLEVDFDLGLRWSQHGGLRFEGSAQLDWHLPVHAAVGPLALDDIHITLGTEDSQILLAASITGSLTLGPVTVSVRDVGAKAQLAATRGSLGPLHLNIAFKPPDGVGLTVRSGVVTGGGYLTHDAAAGKYAGAVQLQLQSLSLAAVGLLSTRLPGGASGYSLVILVSVHFPPVQIGFGFAIDGVGGLLGVNRTVALDLLRDGLQKGSLDSVLFPADLGGNPQKVVGDLERYFPSAAEQYVFGPTVELIWGEGGLFTATVGIFIEFPAPTRVIVAGKLRLALPAPQAAVADIRLDLLGDVDFTAKQLAIDAVLRNSRIAAFALTGQAALRASWGAQPAFLFAAGGWNPDFKPPASFPHLSRLTLALTQSDNPRVRFDAYLALTSNTLQVGANVDLYAAADIPIVGTFAIAAWLGFDALIQFDPFGFVVSIHAGVSLTWNGNPFLALKLDLRLSGPRPFHAVGTATFNCFGDHTIHFEITAGGTASLPSPPATVDAAGMLIAELGKAANWTGELPSGGTFVVLGGSAAQANGLLLHPLGALTVKQRLLPLDLEITRMGEARLSSGPRRFSITAATPARLAAAVGDAFAPAQFLELSDDEKLSRPSFEQHNAGVRLGTPGPAFPDLGKWTTASAGLERHVLRRDSTGGLVNVLAVASDGGLAPAAATAGRLSGERLLVQSRASAAALRAATIAGPGASSGSVAAVAVASPTYDVVDGRLLNPVVTSSAGLPSYGLADEQRRALASASVPGGAQVVETIDARAEPTPAVPGLDPRAYYFLIAAHSGKCLAVLHDSLQPGAAVVQHQGSDTGNEYWQLQPLSDGTYLVVGQHSGLALAAEQIGTENGARVVVSEKVGGFNQQWRLVRVAPGRYRIELVNASRCLDVVGGAAADDAPVQVWDWWGGDNQRWQIVRVPDGMIWHQRILERAYDLWQQQGRQLWDRALADWQRASTEVLAPVIAREAEARYERRGRRPGRDREDWFGAVAEVVSRVARAGNWPAEVRDALIASTARQAEVMQ